MSNATYVITISKIEIVKKISSPSYQVVDQRPLTEKEFNEANREFQSLKENALKMKSVYGYPPEQEIEEEVERKIYEQRLSDLDLSKVIQAANNL